MKSTFITLILTILGMHQAIASDTMHLDIEVNDDGSIKFQPASANTSESGETLELGSCDQQRILRRESFPILQNIPIIQGLPKGQETPTNPIAAKLLDEMSIDELNAVIHSPNLGLILGSDLRSHALLHLEVKRMKNDIKNTMSRYNGQTLMDGPSQRVPGSDIDLKCDAAAYVEGLQLLMAIKSSATCNSDEILMDGPPDR